MLGQRSIEKLPELHPVYVPDMRDGIERIYLANDGNGKPIYWPVGKIENRSVLVQGNTRMGKTFFVTTKLIMGFHELGYHVIIFDSIISSMDGRDYVLNCIDYSANHIMIMDQFAPWEGVLYSQFRNPKAQDIWYVISPALRGGWNIQCALSNSDDRTSYRHPLPAAWYGLRYEELQQVSGIKTAVFCHPSGFLAGAETQEDALAMAAEAMK